MDQNLVYAKTPTGDEAVRQSTRVVQRNLRMVLLQVDGKTSVAELSQKIGNAQLVETALKELEEGGLIALTVQAASAWANHRKHPEKTSSSGASALSTFSTFGEKSNSSAVSNFSTFGKPILPAKIESEPAATTASSHAPRKRPLPIGRLVVGGSLGLVALLAATVAFYPYGRLKPEIESAASRQLGTRVEITKVSLTLFPPALRVDEIHFPDQQASIQQLTVSNPWSLLGHSDQLPPLTITGAMLPARWLLALQGLELTGVPTPSRIRLSHAATFISPEAVLNDLEGDLEFGTGGKLLKARLETADRSLLLDVRPQPPQAFAINVEGRGWQPAGWPVSFPALQAKAVLDAQHLSVSDIESPFLGGRLTGNWQLSWQNAWEMRGDGYIKMVDAAKLAKALAPSLKIEGELSGPFTLRATATDLNALWPSANGVLDAQLTRGAIQGVDIAEPLRRGRSNDVLGGTTRLEKAQARISVMPANIAVSNLEIDSGMVSASGQLRGDRQGALEGDLNVVIRTSLQQLATSIHVSGKLPRLVAVSRK